MPVGGRYSRINPELRCRIRDAGGFPSLQASSFKLDERGRPCQRKLPVRRLPPRLNYDKLSHDLISAPYPPRSSLPSNGPQSKRRPDYSATGPTMSMLFFRESSPRCHTVNSKQPHFAKHSSPQLRRDVQGWFHAKQPSRRSTSKEITLALSLT